MENGEIIVISEDGLESHKPFPPQAMRPCIFEYIYFSRPDSVVHGRPVYDVRKRMGAQLAMEASIDADVIVPVPDSGVPAAIGYAAQSGVPFELGIIRNHYVGRTRSSAHPVDPRTRRAPQAQRQPLRRAGQAHRAD